MGKQVEHWETAAYTNASAYEVPLTFSTGLTRTGNSVTVNNSPKYCYAF